VLRQRTWRAVARRFDGVMALTDELELEVRQLGYTGPVWVIGNARDPSRFVAMDRDAASESLRAQIGIADAVPLLGFVGHLVDQKQPELAIEVLAAVRNQGRAAHLVVAGDGARRAAMERRIRDLSLESAVTLLGHRDDPELIYAAADLALITSQAEAIPGVAIEAQMSGCPVVSFPVGAVGEVVEDGITGAVLDRADVSLMAERVVAMLADPTALRAMGAAGRARSKAFSMDATAALYADKFSEVLANRTNRSKGPNTPA
jgi:glycosyltransferase involved in cell wall biosynthesis